MYDSQLKELAGFGGMAVAPFLYRYRYDCWLGSAHNGTSVRSARNFFAHFLSCRLGDATVVIVAVWGHTAKDPSILFFLISSDKYNVLIFAFSTAHIPYPCLRATVFTNEWRIEQALYGPENT